MKTVIIMDITTIKYPSHNDLVQWYYQLAQRIADSTGVTPEQVNELIDAYITEHPYPVVPDDIITQSNAPANVVTSVNGEKGDVTVTSGGDIPGNVITVDNIDDNAVTDFNGQKGSIDYTPPVTSVNGMTGNLYTTVFRSAAANVWAFGLPTVADSSIIFAHLVFEFEGIDITYNCTVPESLNLTPIYLFSWIPTQKISGAVQGSYVNPTNKTIKIYLDHSEIISPVQTIEAGCVVYGTF